MFTRLAVVLTDAWNSLDGAAMGALFTENGTYTDNAFQATFTDAAPFDPPHNPAGQSFSVPATSVFTRRGERIASVADYYNLADVLRQMGPPAGPFTPPEAA